MDERWLGYNLWATQEVNGNPEYIEKKLVELKNRGFSPELVEDRGLVRAIRVYYPSFSPRHMLELIDFFNKRGFYTEVSGILKFRGGHQNCTVSLTSKRLEELPEISEDAD